MFHLKVKIMKVLTFPSEFNKEELDSMTGNELYRMKDKYSYECEEYCSEEEFQEAFNSGCISDCLIYFID